MVRFVTNRESTEVGCCIYCGRTDGALTEEHVSPFGLNGCITLLHASCDQCAVITSRIELHVLRDMWGAARAEMNYRTRHTKRPTKTYCLTTIYNGAKLSRNVPLRDALKIIELPIFPPPAELDGRSLSGKIAYVSKDQIVLTESREQLAKRLGVDEVCPPEFDPEIFARFIAKCSYGYAIERYGITAFDSIYVRSAILGTAQDIERWVGCSNIREFPVRATPMSGGFKILENDNLIVKLKLFPRFDGAEYVTIVGKLNHFQADQYRQIRSQRVRQGFAYWKSR